MHTVYLKAGCVLRTHRKKGRRLVEVEFTSSPAEVEDPWDWSQVGVEEVERVKGAEFELLGVLRKSIKSMSWERVESKK